MRPVGASIEFGRETETKRRQKHMNLAAELVDAVKTPAGPGVATRDMVAVVGKLFARREAWSFTDDLVAFNDETGAIAVLNHPFTA